MTIYYVAKTGNDSNSGTDHANPKVTIASAAASAYAGSSNIVEIIDSGQYNEGDIEIYSNAITVRATGSNAPILDGDSGTEDHAFETYISGCAFQGLTFRNFDEQLINGFNTAGMNFILSGCLAYDFGTASPYGQKIGGAGFSEIHDCKIVSEGGAGVIPSTAGSSVWINNSIIATNKPGAAALKSSQALTNVTASFCTFIGSGYNNSSARNYHLVDQVYKVINCIVSGSGDGINAFDSTYNLVNVSGDPFITWTSDSWDGSARAAHSTEVSGDPLFVSGSSLGITDTDPGTPGNQELLANVSFGTQDFSLSNGTPASRAGISYNGVSVDIIAVERASTPTIGPYEFTEIWTDYTSERDLRFDPDHLTSNRYINLQDNQRYRIAHNPEQVPFSRGVKGPSTLRGRNTPYKVDK